MAENRIKELREERGITKTELASIIGVSVPTITYWERNEKRPRQDKVEKLSDFFNTSIPYLLGLTDLVALNEVKYSAEGLREEDFKGGIDIIYTLNSKKEYEILNSLHGLNEEQLLEVRNLVVNYSKDNFDAKLQNKTVQEIQSERDEKKKKGEEFLTELDRLRDL